jgi:hypothetical protein
MAGHEQDRRTAQGQPGGQCYHLHLTLSQPSISSSLIMLQACADRCCGVVCCDQLVASRSLSKVGLFVTVTPLRAATPVQVSTSSTLCHLSHRTLLHSLVDLRLTLISHFLFVGLCS